MQNTFFANCLRRRLCHVAEALTRCEGEHLQHVDLRTKMEYGDINMHRIFPIILIACLLACPFKCMGVFGAFSHPSSDSVASCPCCAKHSKQNSHHEQHSDGENCDCSLCLCKGAITSAEVAFDFDALVNVVWQTHSNRVALKPASNHHLQQSVAVDSLFAASGKTARIAFCSIIV